MSSSENERRRLRSGSDKKNTSGPRHFRDDKTPDKKALSAAPAEPEEPIAQAAGPGESAVSSDSEHHSHHSHHSDGEHHSHHSHHSDGEHRSHHSHHSDGEHRSHHSRRSSSGVVGMWDDEIEGEQGWMETAGSNMKKTKVSHKEPDAVAPVEQEDRVKPEKMKTDDEPETSFDYVAPEQTYSQRLKNPGKFSTHTGKTKTASREEVEQAEEGFVFVSLSESDKNKKRRKHHHHHHHHHHSSSGSGSGSSRTDASGSGDAHTSGSGSSSGSGSDSSKSAKRRRHHHHHRMPKWAKIVIIVLCVLLALIIALIGAYFIMKEIGRRGMHTLEENVQIVVPTNPETHEEIFDIDVVDNGRTLVYEGNTYRINNDVVCVGLIGINNDYVDKTFLSMGDAINMIALDTNTGKLSVIAVSRDTMTDVMVYSEEGNYIDTEIMQLTYAYSFESKKVSGGENTASSLSKLFYGLPVDHYFAINMDALITLNDAIGGVTLTSSYDFTSPIREIKAGDTVTLHGKEVEYYVRRRDNTTEGNNARMKRQQEYIRAFLKQVIPAVKKDLSLVSDLYNIIRANSSSNLDLPKIIYLASELTSKQSSTDDIDFITLQGKSVAGKEHTEFYVDDNSVMDTLIKVFYKPA